MQRSNSCPMCRNPLIEEEEYEDDEDDINLVSDDEGDDYDEEIDDYEYRNVEKEAPVDTISKILKKNHFTYEQIVGLLMDRYESHETQSEIANKCKRFEEIVEETDNAYEECVLFGNEDTRRIQRESQEKEDMKKEFIECDLFGKEDKHDLEWNREIDMQIVSAELYSNIHDIMGGGTREEIESDD